MNRIAILGGAFDPPHNAHIAIADNARREFGYEKIIILPSANPPHKRVVGDNVHRLNMTKLAFCGEGYQVCELEMSGDGLGYTVEMIPRLREYLGEDFDYIIGGDSIRDFHKWYRYLDILKQVKLIVAVRDGDEDVVNAAIAKYAECENKGISVMQYRPMSISSSSVRVDKMLGYDISQFVPKSVGEYIADNHLYERYKPLLDKLKASLSVERYEHVRRVAKFAIAYQPRLGLDFDKVMTAAILHDCAKELGDYTDFAIPQDSLGTSIAHAFAGAEYARREYGITDSEVLGAIYYHTTGRADMTSLEKLIFVADMLEYGHDFEGVDDLRGALELDFESGFIQCLRATYEHVASKTKDIYPLTIEAYNYYNNKE